MILEHFWTPCTVIPMKVKPMKVSKERAEKSMRNLPIGFVIDGVIHLAQEQDQEHNDFILREYRGTREYRKKMPSETKWRKIQNGY